MKGDSSFLVNSEDKVVNKSKFERKYSYFLVAVLFSLLATTVHIIHYYNDFKKSGMAIGIVVFLAGLSILYRIKIKKFGFLFLEALAYDLSIIICYQAANVKILQMSLTNSVKVLIAVSAVMLLLDIAIAIVKPSQVMLQPFHFKEILALVLLSGVNAGIVQVMLLFGDSVLIILGIIFLVSMVVMFGQLLVDKFATVAILLSMSAGFTHLLTQGLVWGKLFLKYNLIEIVFISLAIGLLLECSLTINSYKNLNYIFKGIQYGKVNNSYYNKIQGMQAALLIAFMVPAVFISFFRPKMPLDNFMIEYSLSSLMAVLGTSTVIFMSFNIKEWPLYKSLHGEMEILWTREFPKWIPCCKIADIDGDGINEMIVGCADNYIYCIKNGMVLWKTYVRNVPSPVIGVGKVGKDDDIKIVIGSYEGEVVCLNAQGKELWSVNVGYWVWAVILGDVDNDGENEVIAGGMEEIMHVYKDGGKEIWNNTFDSWVGCFGVGDVDGDGKNELVAGSNDQTLRVFKDGPNEMWRAMFGEWVNCCAVGDVDNDGIDEVIGGSNDGTVRCFKQGKEIWRIDTIPGGPGAITIGDADNDGKNEIVLGCGDHTLRVIKDGLEVCVARLDRYPDCVSIGDVDGDGKNEILTGDWYSYLRCFRMK